MCVFFLFCYVDSVFVFDLFSCCLFCVLLLCFFFFFFFSSRRRHTRWTGDWSSDVCSSDLTSDPSCLAGCGHTTAGAGNRERGLRREQIRGDRSSACRPLGCLPAPLTA